MPLPAITTEVIWGGVPELPGTLPPQVAPAPVVGFQIAMVMASPG